MPRKSRSTAAGEKFIEAVEAAINDLGLPLEEVAVAVASEYRDPPLYKDVLTASEYVDELLDGAVIPTPRNKMFFPLCDALGISPLDFDYCSYYLTDIKHYMERKQKQLEN